MPQPTGSRFAREFPDAIRALLTLLAFGVALTSAWATPVAFDIPTQLLPGAIREFTRQSKIEVVYGNELKGISTMAVRGEMEPELALKQILAGTGCEIKQVRNSLVISKDSALKPGSIEGQVKEEKTGKPVADARVSILGTSLSVSTNRTGRFTFDDVPAGIQSIGISANGMQNTRVTDVSVPSGRQLTLSAISVPARVPGVVQMEDYVVSAKRNDGVVLLDPYDVEGDRIRPFAAGNLDLPRTIDDVQPYYIFDTKTIDSSGAVNFGDFLKQRLTMNTVFQTAGEGSGLSSMGNVSSVNLRGVGTDKTLILVNGRRMAGVKVDSPTDFQPDLNGIPLSSIDRIEVLPSSASGIYGGSAMGGVVNVILKRDYSGGEVRASYDNTWDTDTPRRTLSASYGFALEGGRTHVNLTATFSDAKALQLRDRVDIYRRNIDLMQSRVPTVLYTNINPWLGAVPNFTHSNAAITTLILRRGNIPLNSRNTHIPFGFSPSMSAAELDAALLANAGKWNFDLPLSTQGPTGLLRPLGVTPEMRSYRVSVRRQMLSALEFFADFSQNENRSETLFSQLLNNISVLATAPTNPFTTTVRMRVPDAGETPVTTRSLSRGATLGALATLPWGWTGSADYTFSQSDYSYRYSQLDSTAMNADLDSGVLNPFVDTLRFPLNFAKYAAPTAYEGGNRLHSVSIRGSGPLPSLPWGRPNLTAGIDGRMIQTPELVRDDKWPISTSQNVLLRYYAREMTTAAAYAEARVPVVKSDWLPMVHMLELQLAGRAERFEVDTGTPTETIRYGLAVPTTTYGTPTLNGLPYFSKDSYTSSNYTAGVKFEPFPGLTVRASNATAFLPPAPSQLVKNPVQSATTMNVIDPKTNIRYAVYTLSGGNPDLKPQNSESTNVGIIWQPIWKPLAGLRLNAEYYLIKQFDAIGTLNAQGIVTEQDTYADRITRDATGAITLVDASLLNLNHRDTEGWDFNASYTLQTAVGRFSLSAAESIILHLKTQFSKTTPSTDTVHFLSSQGAVKYKANAIFGWEWKRWTAGASARYFGNYKQFGANVPGGPTPSPDSYIPQQGSDTIPSQTYYDLTFGYAFSRVGREGASRIAAVRNSILSGLSMQAGIRNVFDTVPPLDVFWDNNYYMSPFGDNRLRSYWITVKKTF